jgi:hypothetical protein
MLEGMLGVLDGADHRLLKLNKAAVAATLGREGIKFVLGVFDLARRRFIDLVFVSGVHHFFANRDELAFEREIVNQRAVIRDVDDSDRRRCEFHQIGATA